MAIVTLSETISDSVQPGGFRLVMYRYTLDDGSIHTIGPIYAGDGADLVALRTEKGNRLLDSLVYAEINELLGLRNGS